MNALEVIDRLSNSQIIFSNLKYCLVDSSKRPFKVDGTPAKPNDINDFVNFEDLFQCTNISSYAGIGISIQASSICAIDIDHCFSVPNDVSSADDRAQYFLDLFKDDAYCEFSFSGTGLRILFRQAIIEDYSTKYYIKNERYHIEYYQPTKSFRYVTLTGNTIYDNSIDSNNNFLYKIYEFLNKFMRREVKQKTVNTVKNETRSFEDLMKVVKCHYFRNMNFQDLWFTTAPGSGKDESERDYHLVAYLFENVTQDKDLLKQLFESSRFFKTKDSKHLHKWTSQEGRYYNYLYDIIAKTH